MVTINESIIKFLFLHYKHLFRMLSIDCMSIMGHSVYTYNICVCLHVFGSALHVLLHNII